MNLYEETIQILEEYNLTLNDATIVFKGEILKDTSQIKDKLNHDYNCGWGTTCFKDIQVIIDEYTWFERTSYDGCEKYILKAHPIYSDYENVESHNEIFYH